MGTKKKNSSQRNEFTKLVNLSPEEVQRLAKPKEGFAEYAEALFALYSEHASELSVKDCSPSAAIAEYDAYLTLLQMERTMQKQLELVQQTRALRGANTWNHMLDVYARARSAGRSDVDMMRGVSGFAHFMKHRPVRKSAPVTSPPAVTTPVVTTQS